MDEIAFFRDEASAVPDVEVYRAIMPSLIRSNGHLTAISTPYRKLGLLHTKYRDHFGQPNDDVLVVQGSSTVFNPTLSATAIDQATADDPAAAVSEWQGLFRVDISSFLSDADIDGVVDHDRPTELPPRSHIKYCAFTDPSGGRGDAFAICIGHKDSGNVIIDLVRHVKPPFDPQTTVASFSSLLDEYRCRTVTGDNYSADWVESAFRNCGIKYIRSELPKGRLYIEGLPVFTRRTVSLPNHQRLLRELRLLERHVHVGGRDSIDHGRNGHDDLANCLFGVIYQLEKKRGRMFIRHVSQYADGLEHPIYEVRNGQLVEYGGRRGLMRDADGTIRLVGSDNTCWPTQNGAMAKARE